MKIVIDTETTGLSSESDEILQLSIIDESGNKIYNKYIKPIRHTEWTEAMAVNGITPEMVANAPTIDDELIKINSIMTEADTIIGYNTLFDTAFLISAGVNIPSETNIIDVMKDFAPIYGEWSESKGSYKWKKLAECAEYYGYNWGSDTAHDSLSDCRATLFCYETMKKTKYKRLREPFHSDDEVQRMKANIIGGNLLKE